MTLTSYADPSVHQIFVDDAAPLGPGGHLCLIRTLDRPPPAKLPRSAAVKGNPDREQAVLERESAARQVDREPGISHREPEQWRGA